MGFVIFLIIVIIVIVVISKNAKLKEQSQQLTQTAGYRLAMTIADELNKNGYNVDTDNKVPFKMVYGLVIDFDIYKGSNRVGTIRVALKKDDAVPFNLVTDNIASGALGKYTHAIINYSAGLGVLSIKEITEVPKFLEIAATVIKNSGYNFQHPPDYFQYDCKKFLNTMF